jgi:hypothetical protein
MRSDSAQKSCEASVLTIRPAQWRLLTELSFRKTEADIALALRQRFENSSEERVAIPIKTLSDDELASFVHEIVEVGRKHGFVLRGDLYSLVEAVAIFGRDKALLDAMLTNQQLSPREKVCVIVDFCKGAPICGLARSHDNRP